MMLYQQMSGPLASAVRISNKVAADSQMQAVSRIVLLDATNQANSGDCDGDTSIEPREWRDGTAKPVNGGLIPLTIGAPVTDPWGTDYGYCVWDVGSYNDPVNSGGHGCGDNAKRLMGTATPATGNANLQTVIAIISAGPDRHFDTTCYNIAGAGYPITTDDSTHSTTNLVQIAGGKDDVVRKFTYNEAAQSTGLWSLKVGAPATTTIAKNVEVTDPGGGTGGVISAVGVSSTGKMVAGGGIQLDGAASTCGPGVNAGLLKYDAADGGKVWYCNGAGAWTEVGSGAGGGGNGTGWAAASTSAATSTSAAYNAPATGSAPSVTVTTGTTALVALTTQMTNSNASTTCYMGFTVSGATNPTIASTDNAAVRMVTGTSVYQVGAVFLVTGLTAGDNTFTVQYKRSANTCTFANSTIAVATGTLPTPCSDSTPTAFSFTNQTDVTTSTLTNSNIVQATGFNCGMVGTSISGSSGTPKYRICASSDCCTSGNCGSYASGNTNLLQDWTNAASSIAPNQYMQVQLTSSGSAATARSLTLTAGNTTSSSWSVTTLGGNPNPFSFTDQTGVYASTLAGSNAVALAGFTGSLTATCNAGCTAIARNGAWGGTSVAGFVSGDTIAIRLTSSSSPSTAVTASVTVGGTTSGTWTVTTSTDSCTTTTIGQACPDETVYAGLTYTQNNGDWFETVDPKRLYVMRCDAGQTWNGTSCTGTRSGIRWNSTAFYYQTGYSYEWDGRINTEALAVLTGTTDSPYPAAQYCADLAVNGWGDTNPAHGTIYTDWYLPAYYELDEMYNQRTAIGNFYTTASSYPTGWYWSSTEVGWNNDYAFSYRFSTSGGGLDDDNKVDAQYVRCARR